MLIVKLKSTCKAKEDSILSLNKVVCKCLCQTVDLLLVYYNITMVVHYVDASICLYDAKRLATSPSRGR